MRGVFKRVHKYNLTTVTQYSIFYNADFENMTINATLELPGGNNISQLWENRFKHTLNIYSLWV